MAAVPDPVLVRLGEWAVERSLSRQAMADALGVKRPTVAGWMLGLEAINRGEEMPASGREFRFAAQRPEVQQSIADVLGVALDLLRAEAGLTSPPAAGAQANPLAGSELDGIARSLLGDLALGGLAAPGGRGTLRHHIAEVVESVDGVAATAVVSVPRGRIRTVAYQHQIAVLAEPMAPGDDRTPAEYVRGIRASVEAALDAAELTCSWEHGVYQPEFQVTRQGSPLLSIGSLICASLSGSLMPRTGLLASGGPGTAKANLRVAAVVTSPYGGSGPIAGLVGRSLGAGHLRATDAIRTIRNKQARQRVGAGEHGAFLSSQAARDAGFLLHGVLYMLERGDLPGAWLLSLEAAQLEYGPLQQALVRLDGLLVVTHLGPLWRRAAAWRLAAATMNEKAGHEALRDRSHPVSSDWIDTDSARPDDIHDVLRRQADLAAEHLVRIDEREALLDQLVTERRAAGLPVVDFRLDDLPDDVVTTVYTDGGFRTVRGEERMAAGVVFPDHVDGMVDAWTDAAVATLDEIAALTGHGSADALVDPDGRDAVAEAVRIRRTNGGAREHPE